MGKWIKRHKRWLDGYGSKKEKHKDNTEERKDHDYAVMFYAIRCPRCRSKNVKRYKSNLPIRYHKCKDCGLNFKSVEQA